MDGKERRDRYGIVECPHCRMLVVEEPVCCNCAAVFSREAAIDLLVSLGARKAEPVQVPMRA
jgi:hypothetical protein